MDVETVRRIAYELMTEEQAREFENEIGDEPLAPRSQRSATSGSTSSASAARSRWCIRYVRSNIPPFEELRLPPVLLNLVMEKRGLVLDRRRDRLRQVDHARGDDRLPQQQQVGPHPDDRGPDRIPVRAQASRSSTSARSASTRMSYQQGAGQRAARSARPDHDRRNPRPRDDAAGAAAHADRPPVPRRRCTRTTATTRCRGSSTCSLRRALGPAVRPLDRAAGDHLAAARAQSGRRRCSRPSRSCSTRR